MADEDLESSAAATGEGEQATDPAVTGEGEQAAVSDTGTAAADTGNSEGDKAADDGNSDGDKAKTQGKENKPVEYGEFTLPEGVELDESTMGDFKEAAREMGLSQEQAQKLVNLGANLSQRNTDQLQQNAQQIRDGWAEEIKADPQYGGDKLDGTLATAKTAMDAFFSEDFRTFLNETGLGNHPAMIRGLAQIGQKISEDNFVGGDTPNDLSKLPVEERAARQLYGSSS